jgi:serine/threonine protein kinase
MLYGSLRKYLNTREEELDKEQVERFVLDIAYGMKLLYGRHNIQHRDLKSSNILLVSSNNNNSNGSTILMAKVSDFGISKAQSLVTHTTFRIFHN